MNRTPGGAARAPRQPAFIEKAPIKTPLPTEPKIKAVADPEELEEEVCFICASPVLHIAVAPCNHPMCHICSLRMRALYKTKACGYCRTDSEFVIFTDEEKRYEEHSDAEIAFTDPSLGIKYAKKEIQEDTLLLLRYNCPDPSCDVACLSWPDLHRHVRSVHNKVMCDLCTRNKKVFTHEHELFTKEELRKHETKGDDKPGAADQSGFRGHPFCGFCKKHFYSDDELYAHCREKHERCHICDRRNGGRPTYYNNYDTLEQHFRKDHFLCMDRECLEKKFVVYESEMDLKAHQLETHPNGLTKDHRRVDLSDFSYRERYQPTRGRGDSSNRSGGRGRGRDPNSEPLPQSSAQPLRRDELAFQRQQALSSVQVQAAQRGFAGHLTPADSSPQARTPRQSSPARNPFPSLPEVGQTLPQAASPAPMTREQEVRQLRHQAVIDRASQLLKNNQQKLTVFRTKISAYTKSTITAADLIESFFALFDASSAELGKLVKELADIFEIQSKREGLLKAWNDWKAINEDYPSLPGSSAANSTPSGHGGSRLLNLKKSTAQSSKSDVSKKASWGNVPTGNLFPPSQASSSKRNNASSSTPWAGSSSASAGPSAPVRPKAQGKAAVSDTSAFPALPSAAKPVLSSFSRGYNGPVTIRNNGNAGAVNAWGGRNGAEEDVEGSAEVEGGGTDKKKGGRKKQTLIHWG